jgi:hypothetical protein
MALGRLLATVVKVAHEALDQPTRNAEAARVIR